MRIQLYIPCYVDQLMPEVGVACVKVLEKLGHEVQCPAAPCCGQPAFNSGYHADCRCAAGAFLDAVKRTEGPIVVPSGSCAAMVKVFYPEVFHGQPREDEARAAAARVHEFSSFLVEELGVEDLGASFEGAATFHDGCHGLRELGVKSAPRRLLARVRGLELREMKECETCCGFGGTFAVKFPQISTAMAEVKCGSALATGAGTLISNDPSCLLHIQGYAGRQRLPLRILHLAQVLAGA